MSSKSRKIKKQNKTNKMNKNKTKVIKNGKRKVERRTRKMKGGFVNVSDKLNSIRESVKTKFLNILMTGQTEEIKDKIKSMMEHDSRFKKMNLKLDLFMDRVETLIQNFIQTTTTTTIKVTTSWIPGVSFIGALITTAINWTILCFKTALRGYDLYNIYSEMQNVIQEQGGEKIDQFARIGNLRNQAISKVANVSIPPQIPKIDTLKNASSKLQEKAKEVKTNIESKVKDAAIKQITPPSIGKLGNIGKLPSVGNNYPSQ